MIISNLSFFLLPCASLCLLSRAVDLVKPDDFIYVQNGKVEMYKLMMRLVCDKKVGKLTVEDKKPGWKINVRTVPK